MKLEQIAEMDQKYFMNTYGKRTPVSFSHGKGMKLYADDDQPYYDFLGGIAVNALGHAHPTLTQAIVEQAQKYIHCSSLYYIEQQALLAKEIVESSCGDQVFFANSGAEANEGAIKLARMYHNKKGKADKFEIITLEKSFHGRTLATIAATGQEKYQKPYCPLTPKFVSIPMNNIESLNAAINPNTCAIMLEPIQGESGVNLVSKDYMKSIRTLCDQHDIVLIFDEVQCGMGRTGKMYGYEHFDIEPDVFTLAKALGGGFPIGALCAKEKFSKAFEPGDHGSTFGGNPLACAAGLAVFKAFKKEKLVENSEKMGNYLFEQLKKISKKHSLISEVRGLGLMVGIQLNEDMAVEIKNILHEKGFLVGSVGKNIIRLLPPLIIDKGSIDVFCQALDETIQKVKTGANS